jgi:hypothetical protein
MHFVWLSKTPFPPFPPFHRALVPDSAAPHTMPNLIERWMGAPRVPPHPHKSKVVYHDGTHSDSGRASGPKLDLPPFHIIFPSITFPFPHTINSQTSCTFPSYFYTLIFKLYYIFMFLAKIVPLFP